MVIYYLDTSALVKRYVNETGSDWLRGVLVGPGVALAGTSSAARV